MIRIDHIMDMLGSENSAETQRLGVELGKEVKCLTVFLRPGDARYHQNVWENCAKILSSRSDEELRYYVLELFSWLQNLNWPGAQCMFDRLIQYHDQEMFNFALRESMVCAQKLCDAMWEANLNKLCKMRRQEGTTCAT